MSGIGGTIIAPPQTAGWYLVSFDNGMTGLARWSGSKWNLGALDPANASMNSFAYVGSGPGHFTWPAAFTGLSSRLQEALIGTVDHGLVGLKGSAALFDPNGNPIGNSGWTGSEANPTNIIPSPISPNAGNSHLSLPSIGSLTALFGNLGFWKGIGLILAGAGILIFAAVELRHAL